jgi:lipoprotein-anchoring transpeptidase ErfK/SrfK
MKGENNSYSSFARYVTKFNKEHKEYIHDASWRSNADFEMADDIYKRSGSHGCVNAPYGTAKSVYKNCEVGDVVIIRP